MPETIYLIDGTALVYRAHFAFARNPRFRSDGMNVSAIFGFAQTLFALLRDEKARFAAVAFDTAAPTFRHERFEGYKAHRPPMPDDLVAQLPFVRRLVEAAGLLVLEQQGVEADDLIASLARTVADQGDHAVIVSADKDFHQMIERRISQWVPPRGREASTVVDADAVKRRWGVEPTQVLDVLALMGDSVDNVPGVKGIGEKTATQLIQQFGSLEALYERIDEVGRASVREKLVGHRDEAFLSRELVRLRTDLLPDATLGGFRVPDPAGRPELVGILRDLEFRRMLTAVEIATEKEWRADYETVGGLDRLAELLGPLPRGSFRLAIDTETDSLDARCGSIVGISLAWEEGKACYIPLGHREGTNLPREEVRAALAALLEDERIEKVGQNMKFDLHVLAGVGMRVAGPLFDTMVASYLIDPERPHDLDSLARDFLGHRKIPTSDLIGTGKSQTTMDLLPAERVGAYAGEDADAALRLRGPLLIALRERGQEDLYRSIEGPLIPVLFDMERTGVHLDAGILQSLSKEMEIEIRRGEEEIHRLAGIEFNVNSPAQLAEVLFDRLKLRRGRKTKTGYSTDSEVLEELAADAPIARTVLDYRQASKLRSTYAEALPALIDSETGRIHGQFHQTVAATGRLSSSNPNLQNIPIRTPQGRRIRQAFTPQRPGGVLISADYSQVELRILAHLSEDDGLIDAFRRGDDIHAATAARIFDLPLERIDSVMRNRAKTVNFGVLYGMGPVRLSRSLGISLKEARAFIEQYFAKMPGVSRYMEESLEQARGDGFVTTILGRRRYLPGLKGKEARVRAQAERVATNTPIQGSAADLVKVAMIRIHREIEAVGLETRMILQVHDELLFEGPQDERERVAVLVRDAMESAVELRVPLKADLGFGRDWDEAHG